MPPDPADRLTPAGAGTAPPGQDGDERLPVIDQLDELAEVSVGQPEIYLRYSKGPAADAQKTSRDYESGLDLPGLSVVPLRPPQWWTRPACDWVARQVCRYVQLAEGDPTKCAWALTGDAVGSGPDHEPLVARPRPIAILSPGLIDQARRHYHQHFEVGRDSRSGAAS
jgi:hypothetical protein